jgi:hypothetical protein
VGNPEEGKEFNAVLRQTHIGYSVGGGKRAQHTFYLTESVYRDILIIDSKDFKTVITSTPVQQAQAEVALSPSVFDWSKLKLKTSHNIPFHTSSTTTDVSKVLPQFKQLTHDEKLVMPSMGVEWWSELMQTEAYKRFFGFETGDVHHVHADQVDTSRAVRSYADICNGL